MFVEVVSNLFIVKDFLGEVSWISKLFSKSLFLSKRGIINSYFKISFYVEIEFKLENVIEVVVVVNLVYEVVVDIDGYFGIMY